MKKERTLLFSCCVIGFIVIISSAALSQTRTVNVDRLEMKNWKLVKPSGITDIAPTVSSINIRPGEYLSATQGESATIQTLAGGKKRHVLPFRIYGIDRNGAALNLDVVVDDEGGMRLDQADNRFEGILHIGLLDRDRPGSSRQELPKPIELLVLNDQGGIDPSGNLSFSHTNLPFEKVTAYVLAPQEPVEIRIRTSFDPNNPVSMGLPVFRPQIKLSLSRRSLKGWGLEKADVNILVEGFTHPEGKVVFLESTRGVPDPARLTLDDNGTASTGIRSMGRGTAEITASMANAESAQARIAFIQPWIFFIVAMCGGLVGSVIKLLQDKILKAGEIVKRLLIGIFIAIVVAVAFTVGINLVGFAPKAKVGEAVIFVLGAIGGWIGNFTLPQQKP